MAFHEPTFTSLFSTKVIYAGLPRKAFLWNRPLQTSVFFCGCASSAPRFEEGQPKGYFQLKELESKWRFSKNAGSCKRAQAHCFMHIISATDLPNKHSCAQARRRASTRALSI